MDELDVDDGQRQDKHPADAPATLSATTVDRASQSAITKHEQQTTRPRRGVGGTPAVKTGECRVLLSGVTPSLPAWLRHRGHPQPSPPRR